MKRPITHPYMHCQPNPRLYLANKIQECYKKEIDKNVIMTKDDDDRCWEFRYYYAVELRRLGQEPKK